MEDEQCAKRSPQLETCAKRIKETIKKERKIYHLGNIDLRGFDFTIKCSDPFVAVVENFLSEGEINFLLSAAKDRYKRSLVVGNDDMETVHSNRTSSSCMFSKSENPVLTYVQDKVARISGQHVDCQEPFQLVKYDKEEKYSPHFDFFDENTPAGKKEVYARGQRWMTILAYLQEPEGGGTTYFPNLDLHIAPKRGTAVLWFNMDKNGDADDRTQHGGTPVEKGTKVAMNIWVRTKKYV